MFELNEKYYWDKNRQMLTYDQHKIPGVRILGHSTNNRAATPLEQHIHKDCMEMVLLVKGNQSYTVDSKTYPLSGGDLFITFPNEKHSTGGEPQNVSEIYWIQLDLSQQKEFMGLSEDSAQKLLKRLSKLSQRAFWCSQKVRNWFADAFWSIVSEDECKKEYGRSLLVAFLYGVIQQEQSIYVTLSEEMAGVVSYIRQNITEQITLEHLAELVGLSVSRFKVKFKAEIGMSPREYVNQLKINEAKRLLKEGHSVTDTALQLGFNSSNYFAVVFKKMTLFTPIEYQKNKRKENDS